MALDDDVLEQIAEAGFHGTLVSAVHFEVVGHGALLAHVAVGMNEHHAGGIAELRAARRQLSERREACVGRGQILLAGTNIAARATRARTARRSAPTHARVARACSESSVCRVRLIDSVAAACVGVYLCAFAAHVVFFDLELREHLADPLVLGRGVLRGMPAAW